MMDGLIPTEMISQYINVIIIFSRFFVFKNYEKYPPHPYICFNWTMELQENDRFSTVPFKSLWSKK